MAATPSAMIPLGSGATDFQLPDTISGQTLSLQELKGEKGTLVMFICNHCPYVKHLNASLVEMAGKFMPLGIAWVAISANDAIKYPADAPAAMTQHAREQGYPFPYLYDETQEVARAYQAACTPDFFLFDSNLRCVYRGQYDNSRPGNNLPVTGADLEKAMRNLLEGKPPVDPQIPSIGCNIKWKS
jgi:peroxiredoxin